MGEPSAEPRPDQYRIAIPRLHPMNGGVDVLPERPIVRVRTHDFAQRPVQGVLDKPRLYLITDPLARANVLRYQPGEALNWHSTGVCSPPRR